MRKVKEEKRMSFLGTICGFALKVIGFTIAINLIILLVRGGKETIRDIRETILMAIKVGIQKAQSWLFRHYQEVKKD